MLREHPGSTISEVLKKTEKRKVLSSSQKIKWKIQEIFRLVNLASLSEQVPEEEIIKWKHYMNQNLSRPSLSRLNLL